jgi:hypothetical protein
VSSILKISLILLLSPALACAQSKEETIAYLIREIKSLESKEYTVRTIAFSPDGGAMTFRRHIIGKTEKEMVIQFKDVDIFHVTFNRPEGHNFFDLVVRTRGKDATILLDNARVKGTKSLFRLTSEQKAEAMDEAFNRLIELARGKDPFPVK